MSILKRTATFSQSLSRRPGNVEAARLAWCKEPDPSCGCRSAASRVWKNLLREASCAGGTGASGCRGIDRPPLARRGAFGSAYAKVPSTSASSSVSGSGVMSTIGSSFGGGRARWPCRRRDSFHFERCAHPMARRTASIALRYRCQADNRKPAILDTGHDNPRSDNFGLHLHRARAATLRGIQNWGTHWGTTSETSHVIQHIDLADPQSSRRLR
jgi:hypothetical protein